MMKKARKELHILIVIFMIISLFISVVQTEVNVYASAVKLNKTKLSLFVGDSFQLKLTSVKQKMKSKMKWKSSDKETVIVDKKGKLTAKKEGEAIITVKLGKKKYQCKITVMDKEKLPEQAYRVITAMETSYPEGMKWDNENYYEWKGGLFAGGYGCAGFAFLLSDAAFGDLPARNYKDYTQIRVGDIVRMNHDTHSVIVLEVHPDKIVVAEGNYNSSIHWRREILNSELESNFDYALTRYPD